jgi:ATPase subunit of ABC transporter with duplicated ATPase domains
VSTFIRPLHGIGKSCLAAVLAGLRQPSGGRINRFCEVGYRSQGMELLKGIGADILGVAPLLSAHQRVLAGKGEAEDFDLLDGHWDIEQRVEELLQEGELSPQVLMRLANELSGGERTRLSLLALKQRGYQFLVLDEPSNHLDRQGRIWLAQWLRQYDGGVLLVSHDHRLLNEVATVYELTGKGLQRSSGGWQCYQQTREQLRLGAQREVEHSQKSLQSTRKTRQKDSQRINRKQSAGKQSRVGANQSKLILDRQQGRSEKTQSRLGRLHHERVEKANTALQEAKKRLEQVDPLAIVIAEPEPAASPLIHLWDIVLPYGNCPALTLRINAGDRLAVIGSNGSGKSTLMRLMAGNIEPVSGELKVAQSVQLMDQHLSFLDKRQSALVNFKRLTPGWREDQYRTRLAQLRMRGEQALRPIEELSGGEQLKVALACLFCGPSAPSLLLLDEPDNHLDFESKELLKSALSSYKGALVLVSHDDAFIKAVNVTLTIDMDSYTNPIK